MACSQPSEEHPRAVTNARPLTLGELVTDVDDRVRARAAALLAQVPARPPARGHVPTFAITDEVPESAYAEGAVDLPALVAPVRPPDVFADALRKFFPGRRPSPGARRTGTP